jgi:3-phenylpropionate/trans-cinnamate dioxygenase ferredoxin reductase subunit
VLLRFDFARHPLYPRWGFFAALALLSLVVTSVWRQRLAIPYEGWRRAHALLASLAVLFGILHVVTEGHYLAMPLKRTLWELYTALWLGLIVWVRLVKPWLELRRPFVVESVRPERGNAWTLAVAPVGHAGFRFSPGQFGWVTLFDSPFTDREHPFSFSGSAEAGPRLEFTIKELGDFTRRVREAKKGDKVHVDGPFGAISADRHPRATGFVFIAGGIGITPFMSHLRTLADRGDRRPLLLIYANNEWGGVTFREEIAELVPRLNLKVVHVLARPPAGWDGESGFVSKELLERHLPPSGAGREYFICGPPVMMEAVERTLHGLGVSAGDFHSERFNLV